MLETPSKPEILQTRWNPPAATENHETEVYGGKVGREKHTHRYTGTKKEVDIPLQKPETSSSVCPIQ